MFWRSSLLLSSTCEGRLCSFPLHVKVVLAPSLSSTCEGRPCSFPFLYMGVNSSESGNSSASLTKEERTFYSCTRFVAGKQKGTVTEKEEKLLVYFKSTYAMGNTCVWFVKSSFHGPNLLYFNFCQTCLLFSKFGFSQVESTKILKTTTSYKCVFFHSLDMLYYKKICVKLVIYTVFSQLKFAITYTMFSV